MNNRLIPWGMVLVGGFLVWSGIKNKNPVEVAKAVFAGRSPNDVPAWGQEHGIVGGSIGSAKDLITPPAANAPPAPSTPARPISGSDPANPPQVF